MHRFWIKLITCVIPGKQKRRAVRTKLLSRWYSRKLRRKALVIGEGLYCGGEVFVYCDHIELGRGVCFNGASLLGRGHIKIGNYFHSGINLMIMTENHNYEGAAIPYDDTFTVKDVEIDECVWVGYGVTILPGTKIGKGAIIQAGSVVHGEIPPYAIAGGNPAKVFAWRNREHYEELAAKGLYH